MHPRTEVLFSSSNQRVLACKSMKGRISNNSFWHSHTYILLSHTFISTHTFTFFFHIHTFIIFFGIHYFLFKQEVTLRPGNTCARLAQLFLTILQWCYSKSSCFLFKYSFLLLGVSSNEHDRLFFNNVLECIEQMQNDSFVHDRMHRELCDHIQTLKSQDWLRIQEIEQQ